MRKTNFRFFVRYKKLFNLFVTLGFFTVLTIFSLERPEKQPFGFINVVGPEHGTYEIYKIESEEPLQYVSEQIGTFEKDTPVTPGQYLVLADCSSKTVLVRPKETVNLVAHQVKFVPPHPPGPDDKFAIHCFRHADNDSKQYFTNKYDLHVLSGTYDLLVGMKPLSINLQSDTSHRSTDTVFKLAAVRVAKPEGYAGNSEFFISPRDRLTPFTESQAFSSWLYLLPGQFTVETNGTKLNVELAEGEEREILPGLLKIEIPQDVDIELSSQIGSNPLYVELNGNHWLDLGNVYPVLPGQMTLRLNGSMVDKEVTVEENQTVTIPAKSVAVSLMCPPWDWNCLGGKNIYLHHADETFVSARGSTDIPLLFFDEDMSVSVEGSKDIKYIISNNDNVVNLQLGTLKLIPTPQHKNGQITDLVRVEPGSQKFVGHTMDLPFDKEIEVPLIAGQYLFAHYVSSTSIDGDRLNHKRSVQVLPGRVTEIHYTPYVTEKKLASLETQEATAKEVKRKKALNGYLVRNKPLVPSVIE
ncbi:MAG: hypothetical protein AB7T49_03505 [Oligoflexales bacterium]